MEFYDIQEQTKYKITLSKPENMEELSDLFITEEEAKDLIGPGFWIHGTDSRTVIMKNEVERAVAHWAEKLEESGRKTLPIDDEELLDVLKEGYLSDFTPQTDKYGRHGDRICYARQHRRVKKKATQGDVQALWSYLQHGFRQKYGCYPSHIPRYDRGITMFKAFKKIVGWRRVRAEIKDKTYVKFIRQIWDNPEEFINGY